MASCVTLNPAAGSAETMVNAVDCYIGATVQAGYANLLGQGSVFSVALTIALTIYVAIIGYRLIFGRSSLSVGEMMPRMIMIGAVLALTSNWATYQVLVYDVLTEGPQEIVRAINPDDGDVRGITERIDVLSGRMVDLADAWTEFDARPEQMLPTNTTATEPATLPVTANNITAFVAPKDSLGPNMLLFSALFLVLASAGVLVVAKIILGLLLLLGPIFAVLGLFASTRGLALGWGRAAIIMALVPVMTMITSAGAVAALEPILTQMYVSAGQGDFSLRGALTILVIVLIMVAVAVQLFRIGRTIVSGWTLSFGQGRTIDSQVSAPVANVPMPSSNIVYNERMQSLIGAIERSAAATASSSPSNPRGILLPQRVNADADQARQKTSYSDRRISRGPVNAIRAPIKAIRNVA
ncbi:type IV secretion system protein [Sphingorhabdus sp. EL138]|uniref:type IV secretion system protein n=1 Tax=Sphingorhabdus sp. EL138 TaxID=2073156 RepID=UPI0025E57A2D|nr:type IV secretion system protein [Sphingorhabdus sp. EL138]